MDRQQQSHRRQLPGQHRSYREVRAAGPQTLRRPEQVLQPATTGAVPSHKAGPEQALDGIRLDTH